MLDTCSLPEFWPGDVIFLPLPGEASKSTTQQQALTVWVFNLLHPCLSKDTSFPPRTLQRSLISAE